MSGTVSTRWFWSDWMSDPGLRACSYAARGLWKDMLCIAGANKAEYGYVSLNGKRLDAGGIAKMTNGTAEEVEPLLAELLSKGVYSVDRRGTIYCRRMIRAEKSRSNGRLGGNPNLLKKREEKNQVQPKKTSLLPEPEPNPPAIAGGEEPPIDVRTKLFRHGLAALQRVTGKGDGACRKLIGGWLRNTDDDCVVVLRAIEDAHHYRPADPIPWIIATIKSRFAGPRRSAQMPETKNGAASLLAKMMEARDGTTGAMDDEATIPARSTRRGESRSRH